MPYIKVISVRNSVAGCLKYIANPDKTDEQNYLSSLNCSDDIFVAEQEFCLTYQHYSHKNFYSVPNKNGKSHVKAFHIIQSFKAGKCTAEIAHKIGLEWVQTVFGKNFQAVICTHTDSEHIHNHICLCPYDLDGIKFNSNKKSLERIRKVSMRFAGITGFVKWKKYHPTQIMSLLEFVMASGNTVNSVLRGKNLPAEKLIILLKILPI